MGNPARTLDRRRRVARGPVGVSLSVHRLRTVDRVSRIQQQVQAGLTQTPKLGLRRLGGAPQTVPMLVAHRERQKTHILVFSVVTLERPVLVNPTRLQEVRIPCRGQLPNQEPGRLTRLGFPIRQSYL